LAGEVPVTKALLIEGERRGAGRVYNQEKQMAIGKTHLGLRITVGAK
jgi:hypothetical protein